MGSFKEGDIVWIRDDLDEGVFYGNEMFVTGMVKYGGRTAIVKQVLTYPGTYRLDIDNEVYVWTNDMLDLVKTKEDVDKENENELLDVALKKLKELGVNKEELERELERKRRNDTLLDLGEQITEEYNKHCFGKRCNDCPFSTNKFVSCRIEYTLRRLNELGKLNV